MGMRRRKAIVGLMVGATAMSTLGGVAAAGEITGTGEPTAGVANANSICVFSGLNDNPDRPLDGFDPGGKTQSFGQEVRLGLIDPRQFNPGDACQGGSNFARQK